jgi:hypothetical protein
MAEPPRLAGTAPPPDSARFSVSAPKEDNKQKTPSSNVALFVWIVVVALLLVLLAAILIWRLVRRSGVNISLSSSPPPEMGTETLESTEDIDFGATTFDTNPVEELPTDVNLVEPDESLTSVKSIVDDFL